MITPHDVSSHDRALEDLLGQRPASAIGLLAGVLALWRRRARTRLQLAGLEDGELADIGLTRHQAAREAAKSFWQA